MLSSENKFRGGNSEQTQMHRLCRQRPALPVEAAFQYSGRRAPEVSPGDCSGICRNSTEGQKMPNRGVKE